MRRLGCSMQSVRWAFNSHKWQPTKQDWSRAAMCIQEEEKERIGKFYFKRDAKLSMIGRLMMRKVIHEVTGIPYTDIRLARTDKDKPYLVNELPEELCGFSFNVSHHGEMTVLAAEVRCSVGLDVMKLQTPVGASSISEFFRTMKRQFTEKEWRIIKASSSQNSQLNTFYRLWCLKESYVKTLGVGLGFEVKRLDFTLNEPLNVDSPTVNSTVLHVDELVTDWSFTEHLLDNHCIAVAMLSSPTSQVCVEAAKSFTKLEFEDLVNTNTLTPYDENYGETFICKDESPQSLKNRKGLT